MEKSRLLFDTICEPPYKVVIFNLLSYNINAVGGVNLYCGNNDLQISVTCQVLRLLSSCHNINGVFIYAGNVVESRYILFICQLWKFLTREKIYSMIPTNSHVSAQGEYNNLLSDMAKTAFIPHAPKGNYRQTVNMINTTFDRATVECKKIMCIDKYNWRDPRNKLTTIQLVKEFMVKITYIGPIYKFITMQIGTLYMNNIRDIIHTDAYPILVKATLTRHLAQILKVHPSTTELSDFQIIRNYSDNILHTQSHNLRDWLAIYDVRPVDTNIVDWLNDLSQFKNMQVPIEFYATHRVYDYLRYIRDLIHALAILKSKIQNQVNVPGMTLKNKIKVEIEKLLEYSIYFNNAMFITREDIISHLETLQI